MVDVVQFSSEFHWYPTIDTFRDIDMFVYMDWIKETFPKPEQLESTFCIVYISQGDMALQRIVIVENDWEFRNNNKEQLRGTRSPFVPYCNVPLDTDKHIAMANGSAKEIRTMLKLKF